MTGAGRTRSQNESRQRGLSQAEASGRENEPTRKERDIRGHINAFVGRKFLTVVVPVSMATGLALGACNTSAVQPGSGAGGTVIQGTGGYIAPGYGGAGGGLAGVVGGTGGQAGSGGAGGTGGFRGNGGCLCSMGGSTAQPNACVVGDVAYSAGSTNPYNSCEKCDPWLQWSPVPDMDKVSCGSGRVCQGGTCTPACTIEGTVYASGDSNPARQCEQTCQPSQSTTAWSDVPPSHCVTAISAGVFGTCAVVDDRAYCWGDVTHSQNSSPALTPVLIAGLESPVTAISVSGSVNGSLTCVIAAGVPYCWGTNWAGQLGNGTTIDAFTPARVTSIGGKVKSIAAGDDHACAVVDGAAYCWGDNSAGQLGDGTLTNRGIPTQVKGLSSGVLEISVGWGMTCAVVNGDTYCWGDNSGGILGKGTNAPGQSAVPVQVSGLASDAQSLTIGGSHACTVVGGAAYCWGSNSYAILGNTSPGGIYLPVQIPGLASGVCPRVPKWNRCPTRTSSND
jgi:hypothetical protein